MLQVKIKDQIRSGNKRAKQIIQHKAEIIKKTT